MPVRAVVSAKSAICVTKINAAEKAWRGLFAIHVGVCYLGFGKAKVAEEWFQKMDLKAAYNLLALAASAGGDEKRSREEAAKFRAQPGYARAVGYGSGIALARLGPVPEPQKFIAHYEENQSFGPPGFLIGIKGEPALSLGRTAEAIRLLQQAVDELRRIGHQNLLPASDGLALALERNAQPQEALRVLEDASQERFLEYPWDNPYAVFWLRIEAHLAQMYHQLGREANARKIEEQLRKILAFVDPDHPILRQLRISSAAR
jgi:hypothetical protein